MWVLGRQRQIKSKGSDFKGLSGNREKDIWHRILSVLRNKARDLNI